MPKTKIQNWFSKLVHKNIVSALALFALAGGILGGFNYINNTSSDKLAQAAPVCPANYTWNGSTCVSNSPTGYSCPSGGNVNGTTCIVNSCPNGSAPDGNNNCTAGQLMVYGCAAGDSNTIFRTNRGGIDRSLCTPPQFRSLFSQVGGCSVNQRVTNPNTLYQFDENGNPYPSTAYSYSNGVIYQFDENGNPYPSTAYSYSNGVIYQFDENGNPYQSNSLILGITDTATFLIGGSRNRGGQAYTYNVRSNDGSEPFYDTYFGYGDSADTLLRDRRSDNFYQSNICIYPSDGQRFRLCPANQGIIYFASDQYVRHAPGNGDYLCADYSVPSGSLPEFFAGGYSNTYRAAAKNNYYPYQYNPGGAIIDCTSYSLYATGDYYRYSELLVGKGGGDELTFYCGRNSYSATQSNSYNATPVYATSGPTGYNIDINTGISTCTPNINNLNSGDTFNCTFNLSGSPTGTYAMPAEGLYSGIRETNGVEGSYLGNGSLCSISGSVLTCNNIPTSGSSIGNKEIVLHQPAVNWYPNKGTINIATKNYTPTNGQITNLICTPTTQVVGNNVTCTGQATGAPSGVNYSGNITVTIDNGGGNVNTTINSDGTFTASNITVGTTIGSKTATTNLGGTTSITVINPILNTNIQSLACTPTTVTVGGTTDCTITLSGTTTFANLTGSIDFKIGDSGTIKTCNIPTTGNTLTCTAISVGSTAATLTSKFKGSGTTSTFGNGNSITVIPATTPLTPSDIPGLTVTCPTSPVNSTTTCTFTLPTNKTLPTDFKLTIGTGSINQTTGAAQSCSETTGTVTCINVPTGNSVGIISIFGQFTSTAGSKTPTGESVNITGINFGALDWIFNPGQGSTAPLFRSSDNTSITVKNFRTSTDLTPTLNTKYTCTFEYRAFGDRNTTTPTWIALNTTPVAYTTGTSANAGCTVNLTKQQRANALNHSLRLTITDTSITTPTASNPNTYTFYNEYLYRFQGAGVAFGG